MQTNMKTGAFWKTPQCAQRRGIISNRGGIGGASNGWINNAFRAAALQDGVRLLEIKYLHSINRVELGWMQLYWSRKGRRAVQFNAAYDNMLMSITFCLHQFAAIHRLRHAWDIYFRIIQQGSSSGPTDKPHHVFNNALKCFRFLSAANLCRFKFVFKWHNVLVDVFSTPDALSQSEMWAGDLLAGVTVECVSVVAFHLFSAFHSTQRTHKDRHPENNGNADGWIQQSATF